MGFRLEGSGFRVWVLGLRVQGFRMELLIDRSSSTFSEGIPSSLLSTPRHQLAPYRASQVPGISGLKGGRHIGTTGLARLGA